MPGLTPTAPSSSALTAILNTLPRPAKTWPSPLDVPTGPGPPRSTTAWAKAAPPSSRRRRRPGAPTSGISWTNSASTGSSASTRRRTGGRLASNPYATLIGGMSHFICVTCGMQYDETGEAPPAHCLICEDERQYIGPEGQRWTTLADLQRGHHNEFRRQEERLVGIGTAPSFAIGQRALLVQSPAGNVLWDCVTLLDEFTKRAVTDLGGIAAIAISHRHYYSPPPEWSAASNAPVYLPATGSEWA